MVEAITNNCPLCKVKNRDELEKGIRDSTYSKGVVARELEMTTVEVYNHMMHHTESFSKGESRSLTITMSKKEMLMNTLFDLNDRFSKFIEMDDYTANTTKQIIGLAGEIRNAIMNLAKLEGEIEKEQQVTIIMYNEFKSYILSVLNQYHCPECKAKLGNSLVEELSKFREETVKR